MIKVSRTFMCIVVYLLACYSIQLIMMLMNSGSMSSMTNINIICKVTGDRLV